ncbi:MAG: DeoR/GlpR transcriptional regulator [Ignavibacteriales bacterium]|jgi:DeoR family transcriptional regulator of aga operon|uniref:Transcriptional repressor AgaR n=1 Tax=Stygiobacter electus TaxID=3032292 RepID=A0AAE3TAV1_9BACT|nr:transcriptional repressor AgaR [Stygiobacter electus]MBI5807704.1 DeoR/GlpR transcriptional regulator [Ignavibacteriales bacterium]MDF1610648.1 transcriptional repressor AgaR [Stygiobacter electus]
MDKISTIDRRLEIINLVNSRGQVSVNNLSQIFNVSEVTIRNDLSHLEKKGLIIKTRGGGLKIQSVGIDQQLNEKAKINAKEKQAIGKKAAELIKDNETIIIDSGTTTVEIAKNIINLNNLTVITNALNIASKLIRENVKLILLGGFLRTTSLSLVGPIAENSIRNFYCDKCFIGVDGIDSHLGIYTPIPEEAYLNRLMIENSKEAIVVADSSKFKKKSLSYIVPINKINTIITDSKIPKDELKNLLNIGIKVILV